MQIERKVLKASESSEDESESEEELAATAFEEKPKAAIAKPVAQKFIQENRGRLN